MPMRRPHSALRHPADDLLDLGLGKGAQRMRLHEALLGDGEQECGHRLVVGRLVDDDAVVGAERPMGVLHGDSRLLGHRLAASARLAVSRTALIPFSVKFISTM